jgi:hypothetical protein
VIFLLRSDVPERRVEHYARRRYPQTRLTKVNVRSHDGERVPMSYSLSISESRQGRKRVESVMRKKCGGCLGVDSLPGR